MGLLVSGLTFGFVTPANVIGMNGGVGSSISRVLGENNADTPTDKLTNCMRCGGGSCGRVGVWR